MPKKTEEEIQKERMEWLQSQNDRLHMVIALLVTAGVIDQNDLKAAETLADAVKR